MKVEHVPVTKKFEPVSLKLTFETPRELAAFYALFNHVTIGDIISRANDGMSRKIRLALINANNGFIPEGYEPFHSSLCKRP